MGLLTCARCGCSMTAEKKKGKYVYYRCTGLQGRLREHVHPRGAAGGVARRRDQADSDHVEIAEDIATALRDDRRTRRRATALRIAAPTRSAPTHGRQQTGSRATKTTSPVESRRSSGRGNRQEWEAELATVDAERPRLGQPAAARDRDGREDFRTREKGRNSLQNAESDRTASTARNGAIELHLRSRKSLSYLQ